MSPRVRTLVHGIESLTRFGVPDFKGKPTTYYLLPSIYYFVQLIIPLNRCHQHQISNALRFLE
jgi:hypothetical protein